MTNKVTEATKFSARDCVDRYVYDAIWHPVASSMRVSVWQTIHRFLETDSTRSLRNSLAIDLNTKYDRFLRNM